MAVDQDWRNGGSMMTEVGRAGEADIEQSCGSGLDDRNLSNSLHDVMWCWTVQ